LKLKSTIAIVALLGLGILSATFAAAAHYTPWSAPVPVSELNSDALEGCPGLAPDGLTLYFVSNRGGGLGGTDIWVTTRASADAPWGEPANPGAPLNSRSAEICPTPLNGGQFLFVSDRPGGCGQNDLYSTRLHPVKGWLPPENLGCQVNSAAQDITPSRVEQPNGTFLYFASNRPGGFDPTDAPAPDGDIYFSMLQPDGSFGPASLVPGVNTAANDSRPNVRKDGLEIFFDSQRVGGQGGFDIWSSSRESVLDDWTTPINLGEDVNSPADEMRAFLSWDGTVLYFGSTRAGGMGSQDLYSTTREKIPGGP
jgi:hypothetical protein